MDYYSPATASPPSRSKRSHSVSSSDFGDQPAQPVKKAKGKRSSAAREQRMERNRQAAQASRDRKKLQQEAMESRIAELEAQLAAAATARSTVPASSRHEATTGNGKKSFLDEENESLRTQLQLERLESGALKARLSALEMKFSRLADLLGGGSTSSSVAVPLPTPPPITYLPTLPTPPPTTATYLDASSLQQHVASDLVTSQATSSTPVEAVVGQQQEQDSQKMMMMTMMEDSLRLVAREVSLPRKLSQVQVISPHPPQSCPPRPSPPPLVSSTSTSAPLSRPQPRRQPTLHQILSSISLPSSISNSSSSSLTPITRSPLPSTTGLPRSTSAVKMLVSRRSAIGAPLQRSTLLRNRSRPMRRDDCSRSSSISRRRRFQLFVRR